VGETALNMDRTGEAFTITPQAMMVIGCIAAVIGVEPTPYGPREWFWVGCEEDEEGEPISLLYDVTVQIGPEGRPTVRINVYLDRDLEYRLIGICAKHGVEWTTAEPPEPLADEKVKRLSDHKRKPR
jgi:hypothetical protein